MGYEDLGTLGGRSSEGFAINGAGQAAGYWESATGGGNRGHYALWEPTTTNAPPTAVVHGPYTGTEGSPVSVSATGSADNDGDVLSYSWDFGDGTAAVSTSGTSSSHTYADNGVYTLSLTVSDGKGGTDTKTATATVANAAPTVGAISTSSGAALLKAGTTVSASAPFTDPGTLDSQTGTILWDVDNAAYTPTTATITKTTGATSGTVSASRSLGAGVYTVRFDVRDKDFDAGNSTAANYIVVYDAKGGSVAGNGVINAPAGACTLVSCGGGTTIGPATFAFSAKYKKGTSTAPTGSTDFRFTAGALSFSSSTINWLVVSGPLAQYKGTGKINKKGSYSFLITAIDGQINGGGGVDKFRIKIWDTGTGNVVYDNSRGEGEDSKVATALSSGSIAILP
jgi:PKD repeat protein